MPIGPIAAWTRPRLTATARVAPAAIEESNELFETADRLFERMRGIPARTQAGRAAKVHALIRHVLKHEWRGKDIEWPEEQVRAVLGELAGLSAEELATI
jgi:hypothetical protein